MKTRHKVLITLLFLLILPNLGYFSMVVVAVPDFGWFTKGKAVSAPVADAVPSVKDANGIEFVLIPAGRFQMGTPFGADVSEDEIPQHWVTISQPFYLGRYEVTQAQWESIMGSNPSEFKGADRPVDSVSWDETQIFIGKLNEKAGGAVYRLPTEAEWEYAVRAGTETTRYWGDGAEGMDQYAWYGDNAGKKSHPVGQLKPNAWGLYDMLGNVWEWCQDRYSNKTYTKDPVTDPQGPVEGAGRVMRGGGWNGYAGHLRAAYRFELDPGYRRRNLGLRLRMEKR
ncbi:MAG: formylglycine-generating enzyme family protein [Magnetococcales bacterium]|nr:formylglycine-generating enzyme family protein [Magnetococcales bacterium]